VLLKTNPATNAALLLYRMDIRTALKFGIAQLRAAKVPSDTLAAEILLLHATGRTRTSLYSHPEDQLTESESQNYVSLIERRASGVPTQHLIGKQEFWGLEFEVTAAVLIPRPETEHVIEVALDRLAVRDMREKRTPNMSGEGLAIADIGTGSACIAIALAKELPSARIYALDVSPHALAVAQRNAERLGFSDRIIFLESDLLTAILSTGTHQAEHLQRKEEATQPTGGPRDFGYEGPITGHKSPMFDLIVSNPPYIGRREAGTLAREVREHEPAVALFGGEEGYELYADLVTQAAAHLKSGGILVLELGHDSLAAVRPLLEASDWTNTSITNDLAGIPRVLSAECT
jgi:release factor glutamine methyltransferase